MQGLVLDDTTVSGGFGLEDFTFTYSEFNRKSAFKTKFFAINYSSNKITGDFTGYIGIKPYTGLKDPNDYDNNLLFRTWKNGNIDHIIVSIYMDKRENVNSTIKVGGWDQIAIKKGHQLDFFRCATLSSWIVQASQVTFGGQSMIPKNDVRYL